MRRAERRALAALTTLGATAAVARLRALQSLSPPDLAFFHQATWNAAQGNGFVQTALEFDAGSLLGSVHLSLIRVVWVPLYALMPAPETLVALQGAVLMGGTAAVAGLIAGSRARSATWLIVLGLHPMTVALATCDLRPLTFIVAPSLLVIAGLLHARTPFVVLGAAGAILAREEAWMLLSALLPFAIVSTRAHRKPRLLFALASAIITAWALPRAIWGHGANVSANADLFGTLQALWNGDRDWFRWPVELYFAARCMLAAWPAVRCPELLVPAAVGWLGLMVFSNMEPSAPVHGGLHYLAVLAPLLLGAAAVGWHRICRDAPSTARSARSWWVVAGIVLASPELGRMLHWTQAALHRSPLAHEITRVRHAPGGVLALPSVAPLLSGRPVLRIQGHFSPTPGRVATVASEIDHALLTTERPADGPPAEEWDTWQSALPAAGLNIRTTVEGVQVWER
ncbi:MAG: hypothetical protein CL927_07900 [Deltaproteobacteria bacterium]|nr:hypothetical protein [Deltaproteobacteria bacterium]